MATFTWLLLAALAAGLLYGFVVRRWLLAWGATRACVAVDCPNRPGGTCDSAIPFASIRKCRDCRCEQWPETGRWCSAATESAQHIPPTTWVFVLEPADRNQTRLLIRWRSQTPRSLHDLVFNKYLLEPIHVIMERKMMLGIRRRAETRIELR